MTLSPDKDKMTNTTGNNSTVSNSTDLVEEQPGDWQSKMLKRLIDSAPPVPIKVAHTVSPPGIPEYLGEEYHGRISKEEEKKLLEGKSGRYIVRESFTASRLHEYTLAFNHDYDIQHVKLIYNPLMKTFKTDSSGGKDFKTVLELMTDVLKLFRDLNRRQSNVTTNKKEKYSKPHVFKSHNYKHPKWCDECGQFLWGLRNQGYKCEDCGLNVHRSCKELAPLPCLKVVFGRKSSFPKEGEERLTKKRGSKVDDVLNGRESPPSSYVIISKNTILADQCQYFKQCSRFLSAFNIRDAYIDIKHSMTRCFCDRCIESKMENEVPCSNLKQWTRFRFDQQDDKLKRNITDWEVVYFAIKPQFIIGVIKDFLNPPIDNTFEDLVVAPSLAYTVQDMINENWAYKFTDTRTAGELYAQTVLEVYVKPGSYEVMVLPDRHNTDTHECGAPLVPENWKVKKQSDMYPKSILVKIFGKEKLLSTS